MIQKRYTSLAEIRSDKERERMLINYGVDKLKNDVEDCLRPKDNYFLNSSSKYMNYIGYALTAYKTAMTVKGLFSFFSKKR